MRTRKQAQAEYTWLTPAEFGARAGGLDADTIRAYIEAKEIRDVLRLPNGHYRIPPAELSRWIQAHTINKSEDRGAAA